MQVFLEEVLSLFPHFVFNTVREMIRWEMVLKREEGGRLESEYKCCIKNSLPMNSILRAAAIFPPISFLRHFFKMLILSIQFKADLYFLLVNCVYFLIIF